MTPVQGSTAGGYGGGYGAAVKHLVSAQRSCKGKGLRLFGVKGMFGYRKEDLRQAKPRKVSCPA